MTLSSLKSLNWSPPPKYNMFLKQWAESIQSFKTWCLASRRWSHFPPNDSATLLQRHGPEAWKLQGAGRCKDVASSLASHWDLLSGCLEAAWAYWPHLRHMPGEAWLSHQMRTSVWWHNWPCSFQVHIHSRCTPSIPFNKQMQFKWVAAKTSRDRIVNKSVFCCCRFEA